MPSLLRNSVYRALRLYHKVKFTVFAMEEPSLFEVTLHVYASGPAKVHVSQFAFQKIEVDSERKLVHS